MRLIDADKLLEVIVERKRPENGADCSKDRYRYMQWLADYWAIKEAPTIEPVQPTLYGYNIEHLVLIASVLQRENIPPERVTEMLTDIGRIASIVIDEFEESLKKAVEQTVEQMERSE